MYQLNVHKLRLLGGSGRIQYTIYVHISGPPPLPAPYQPILSCPIPYHLPTFISSFITSQSLIFYGATKRRITKRRVTKRRISKHRIAKRRIAKRRITKHRILQNVESYKTSKYKTLNLTERRNTKRWQYKTLKKWQDWMVHIYWEIIYFPLHCD